MLLDERNTEQKDNVMIRIRHIGNFHRVTSWLEKLREAFHLGILDKYGKLGVEALSAATPVDSGLTAASWSYEIQNEDGVATISFNNSNINNGVNIALILQYGHGTGTGGYVAGRDYINPAIQPVFDELANDAWKEVLSL